MWPWKKKAETPKEAPKPTPLTDRAWETIYNEIAKGNFELAKWYLTNWEEN
jgi:hypothetical protein